MQEQITQLFNEVFAASTILPTLLSLMPKFWANETKKLVTFLGALILTLLVASQNADFAHFNYSAYQL